MKTTSTSHSYVPWREKSWSSRFIHSSPVCSILLPQVALLLKSRTPPATSHHTREQSLTLPALDQGPSTRSSSRQADWTGLDGVVAVNCVSAAKLVERERGASSLEVRGEGS